MKRTYFMAGSAACVASVALMLVPEMAFAQRGEGKGRGGGGRSGNVSRGESGRGGGSSNRGGPSRQGNVTRSQPSRQVTPNTRPDAPARVPDVQRRVESTQPRDRTPSGVVTRPDRDRDMQNRDNRTRDDRDRTNSGVVTRPDRDGNRNDGNRNNWNDWNRNRNDRDRDWADVNRNWNNWNRDRNDWDRDWNRDRRDWDRNDWTRYWSRNRWSNPYAGWNWGQPNYWNRYYRNGYFGSPFFGYGGYNRYPYYGYGGYGLGGWLPGIGIGLGLGRVFGGGYGYGQYGYGYPGYYNGNYYTGYRGDYVDNSTVTQEQPPAQETQAEGTDFLASARSAFESGDYEQAQRFANHAVIDDPQNAKAHELISLAMFAQGNFAGAAQATHATVALGSLPDWPTLYGYYNDRSKYEEHFNALKQFAGENPQAPEGQFLLGAHHLMMGHQDSAREAFARYLKLVDHQDQIGIQLYGQAGGNVDALPKPTTPPPGAEGPEGPMPENEGTEG